MSKEQKEKKPRGRPKKVIVEDLIIDATPVEKEELLTEVPPIEEEDSKELLTEVPPLEEVCSGIPTGEELLTESPVTYTPAQRKMMLQNYSKRTLMTRFGIKF